MCTEMPLQRLPFQIDSGLGSRARIGLVVLQSDQTIEHEFRSLFQSEDVALYHARIPNTMEVSPQTLRQMEADLPVAAALLPPEFKFDALAYCCTSGATMIGEGRIDEILQASHPTALTTNPLTACKAALKALGLKKIALITPYALTVTSEMRENLSASGIDVQAVASFDQSDDFTVARISPASIQGAIEAIGAREDCDGVFVSCTSLRTLSLIASVEVRLGKPVISSNQALAWHLMRLAGMADRPQAFGQLFNHDLAEGN